VSESSPADPRNALCFEFTRCAYDPASGVARLGYRFDGGPELVERIRFPHAPWPPEASRQAAFGRALEILHAVAGVSYYKAGVPQDLRFEEPGEAAGLRDFLRDLYLEGLGEFAHVNGLDLADRLNFPEIDSRASESGRPAPLMLPDRALVAMGGGKDSLVGLAMLRDANCEVMPVCVGESALIRETVSAAGLPLLQIERSLAPELAEMNRAGAWNGHVPVTAINSAILLCGAILYGFRLVVFSNERSADEATLVNRRGIPVNHQYSKSSAFEAVFRRLIRAELSPDIEYFSVLRPFSELGVLQRFSRLRQFHDVFSSCNRNFHLDGPRVEGRWCGECPKCRFAALGLALFLEPAEVTAIQGRDLLNEPGQEDGFRALCRLGRDKPFECVGEAGESRAALAELGRRAAWQGHSVVQALRPELEDAPAPTLDELLTPSARHYLPSDLASRLELEKKDRGLV
jgi:hypothetical protein